MITFHSEGSWGPWADIFINKYIEKGWVSIPDAVVDSSSGLEEAIKKFGFQIVPMKYNGDEAAFIVKESVAAGIVYYHHGKGKATLSLFFSPDGHLFENISNAIETLIKPFADTDSDRYMMKTDYFVGARGLAERTQAFTVEDLKEVTPAFYPFFTDFKALTENFISSPESILILAGPTGVGKSKFFTTMLLEILKDKKLYEKVVSDPSDPLHVVYVKDERILADDTFWIKLQEEEVDFVILDDLDDYLAPRDSENLENQNRFVSKLLSFSDGIIPTKTKFLISTNREISKIDGALLRAGRLYRVFQFRYLIKEEALSVWKSFGLKKKDFERFYKDSNSILQADLGSKIKMVSNGLEPPESFLKKGEEGIDITKKYARNGRVGF